MRPIVIAALLLASPAALAEERANPFACLGEGEALTRGVSTAELEAEIRKRVANPPADSDGKLEVARHHCVTAELMRRVGDPRAPRYYEKAIATDPHEPGLELWYGYYLRNVRGPRYPLINDAEPHYFGALDKMRAVRAAHESQDFDDATDSWVRRGLMSLYQEDGLPLLRSKAFPYRENGTNAIGAALTSMVRFSQDTNEFGSIDDARRYAAEAAFAQSPQRLGKPLTQDELRHIIRTPMRLDVYNRVRLRLPFIGAIDASYDFFRAPRSQVTAYTDPNTFNDVKVDALAVAWKRPFNLYPLFDLLLDVGYRRVERVGVVEWVPDLKEGINLLEAHPAISRFLGPDKLTLGMNYVFMDIPVVPGGLLQDRKRARSIRAFYFEYAIYRQLLLPDFSTGELKRTPTRGLHLYGGYALDDEAFGSRVSYRRDAYGGISLRGVGGGKFDFTVQGTVLTSDATERRYEQGQALDVLDAAQSVRQLRPAFILLYRIVDDEAIPDVPRTPLAGLNVVVPVRADFAQTGPDSFNNVRGGVELWSKLISTGLRGTHFLVTAGYEAQYFYRVSRLIHMARLELRMGWGTL